MSKTYYSNGKLLLTGEYVVLDGAKALAIPTQFGQSLTAKVSETNDLHWTSLDKEGNIWFEESFTKQGLSCSRPEDKTSQILSKILKKTQELNSEFWQTNGSWKITTQLDFPKNWGLGSSSTLINNIAQWTKVDAFKLLRESFGGSGYDIAAAQNDNPILYVKNQNSQIVEEATLSWEFTEALYFVYLNRKQDSKEGIQRYRKAKANRLVDIDTFSKLTKKITTSRKLSEFSALMETHENLISSFLETPTIKSTLFPDFSGLVKSLGAWGGDFVLVAGDLNTPDYFKKRGYRVVIPFSEMIK